MKLGVGKDIAFAACGQIICAVKRIVVFEEIIQRGVGVVRAYILCQSLDIVCGYRAFVYEVRRL